MLIIFCLLFAIIIAFRFFPSRKNHLFFKIIVSILFVLFVTETVAYGYLLWKIPNKREWNVFFVGNQYVLDRLLKREIGRQLYGGHLYIHSSDTGYALGSDVFEGDLRQTTPQGFRGDREYPFSPDPDKLRIVAIGDSYVFCDGEKIQDCWTRQLERLVGGVEVLNFGVSGYGLGQSYVRLLKKAIQYDPDVIYWNYVLTNERDSIDAENILKGAPFTDVPFFRVNFALQKGQLIHKAFGPLDFFDRSVREKYIYGRLGLSEKTSFWSLPFFSFSNLGVIIKIKFAPIYYAKRITKTPELPLDLNLRILEHVLKMAEDKDFSVVFFVKNKWDELPLPVRQLLGRYKHRVDYLTWPSIFYPHILSNAVKSESPFSIVNETLHFNVIGNLFYADMVGFFLKSRPWKHGNRVFYFDSQRNAFVRK